jgi:hypothetical protein
VAETKLTVDSIKKECTNLQTFWKERNDKIKLWYDVLLLKDEFEQADMESFVSNDPRTFFNLAVHLLSEKIPHRIPVDTIEQTEIQAASEAEIYIEKLWSGIDKTYRLIGRESFIRFFTSMTLATGWYSLFSILDDQGVVVEVWNPMQVYPEWDEAGLSKCARIYTLTAAQAKRKIARMKWTYKTPIISDVVLYNYWWIGDDLGVYNAVVLGNEFVKPETKEKFNRIPVFISPVAGLPDEGIIKPDKSWKEHRGEAVVATNELMYRQYNKQWTFSSQILRDTAQPRWLELSRGDPILRQGDMFKRGAIFRGAPEDTVKALEMPPIPVELRTDRMDIQGMMQRGSLPWALWGDISGQMTGYLMSQVASMAKQVLRPYQDAIIAAISDIDNFWLDLIKEYKFNPLKTKISTQKPIKVLDSFEMSAEYSIKIPGDLVQRATVARMVCPGFQLDINTTTDLMFPEIKNPTKVQAAVRRDKAMSNEVSILINTIAAYKANALQLRELGDTEQAELYEKAAEYLLRQFDAAGGQEQQGIPTQQGQQFTQQPRQEAMPRQAANIPPELM